jgi:hypothetical protein
MSGTEGSHRSSIVRSLRVDSDATVSLEPSKSAVAPSPERQHERCAMTIRAWAAVVLDDFRALTRGILEYALEIVESGFRDFSTMKEKLLLWSDEVTRGELTQKLVVDVALHGPAGTPALVDLAVVDPATHSLVLRAGGSDTRHGNVSLVRESVELRDAARGGFDAATQQMIEHFDDALRKFESDVHEGKANVRVVSNRSGGIGGGGSLDRLTLFVLLPLVVIGTRKCGSGRT